MTLEEQVASATPAQLISMLYDRCIKDLKGANDLFSLRDDLRAQADAIHMIVHAQQIISELQRSLNLKEGGDLASNLNTIYEYMQMRLTEAVSQRDMKLTLDIIGMLEELHESWTSTI